MKVFVTGASGFIGSAVVQELIKSGHKVLGLARSDKSEKIVESLGAEVFRGDLDDLSSIKEAVSKVDAVIHLGFNHDFSRFMENCQQDKKVIQCISAALVGTDKPLVVTSGINLLSGKLLTEDLKPQQGETHFRSLSEEACQESLSQDVNVRVVRLAPSVHGKVDDGYMFGFVSFLIGIAQEKGISCYVGEGDNSWSAIHRLDASKLFVLAMERGKKGGVYHGVGDRAVRFFDIASAIGEKISLPVKSLKVSEAESHFTWLASFVSENKPASSELTQKQLGWHPTHLGLLEDLDEGCLLQKNG